MGKQLKPNKRNIKLACRSVIEVLRINLISVDVGLVVSNLWAHVNSARFQNFFFCFVLFDFPFPQFVSPGIP